MGRVRLGVALVLGPPAALEIEGLRRSLGDGALGRIGAHLTLVPPVNVAERDVGMAVSLLRAAGAATRPFRLELGPPASFWPDTPVVHLPVSAGTDEVLALREGVFLPPLARPLSWPFVPHVTLADDVAPEVVPAALAALSHYRREVVVDRVFLLQERPDRVWQPLADAELAAPAVVGRGGVELELTWSARPDPDASAWLAATWQADARSLHGEGWTADEPFALTARREDRVVGVAVGRTGGGICRLDRLAVDRAERGLGIGTRLLASVESLAVERGCGRCRLQVAAGGRAEAFFGGRGWQTEQHLFHWRQGRDFLVMVRRLA